MKNNNKNNKGIKKLENFQCDWCSLRFNGKPHVIVTYENMVDGQLKICSDACWKDFLVYEPQLRDDLFHDEILMSYPVQQLIDFLKNRIDYDEVLTYIRESIENFRSENLESKKSISSKS